jgi:hypothetical protein
MSLKRKHVVFDDDAQSAPVAGPSSSGHIRFAAPPVATIPAAPAQPALSKPKVRFDWCLDHFGMSLICVGEDSCEEEVPREEV